MRDRLPPDRRVPSCARCLRRGALLLLLAAIPAAAAKAQGRTIERHPFDSDEGRLLGFYSAALAFTAAGPGMPGPRGAIELSLEAGYVPYLTREQRKAGADKPQASNLAPAFPRPRLAVSLPGRVRAEASWIPPLPLFEATANLVSIAVSRPVAVLGEITLVPRLALTTGRIEGAITCNDDLARGSQDRQVYWASVCHGRESEDHFEPTHVTGELLVSRPIPGMALVPYAGVGVRREDVRFDIGVIRADGTRDPDHPVLEMEATRPFALLGAQWRVADRFSTGSEVFIAPGSLVTARLVGSLHLGWR